MSEPVTCLIIMLGILGVLAVIMTIIHILGTRNDRARHLHNTTKGYKCKECQCYSLWLIASNPIYECSQCGATAYCVEGARGE